MRLKYPILYSVLIFILGACSLTRNVPEDKYLLNSVSIETDTKNASEADLSTLVRQQPNEGLPLLGRIRLKIYNLAGADTSKWINRTIHKIGEPPVIYSSRQTAQTVAQLQKELSNLGYLNAEVDTIEKIKKKKMNLIYKIRGKEPYRIRNYSYAIEDTTMTRILNLVPRKLILNKGDMFNVETLELERERVNEIMRNVGYYNFSKDYVYFKADTTLNSHQVDLFLSVYPAKDSLPHSRYKLNKITIVTGFNAMNENSEYYYRDTVTTDYKDIFITRGRDRFLRSTSIYRSNFLHKDKWYSDFALNNTYQSYNNLGAVKQVSIVPHPSPQDSLHLLDMTVTLIPANPHWFKASIDGTNSEGDIGVAPSVSYQHQNLFNGAEQLGIRLKGAYEFITGDNKSYYEIGGDISLTFPQFVFPYLKKSWRERPNASTKLSIGLTTQHRPEYTRQFFNATIGYNWVSMRNRLRHGLDLFDINYVRMPWVDSEFKEEYLDENSNPLLKASYDDQLIARTAYTITLVNGMRFNSLYPTYTLRGNIELAGALPRLITALNGTEKAADGHREIVGVRYAEYIKGGAEYSRTFYFSKTHSLAYRIGLGLAYPFGNSTILPFERRYFSGGANSVRGWSTRSLGPGSYQSENNSRADFVNQTGDVKFDMNIESRHKMGEYLELAAFIDAGNIWTLKKYDSQKDGQFKFSEFYKEIAASYGVGIRFDLGFLLLRFDTGVRAYDPGRDMGDRFVLFSPTLRRMAWHFGIGYPF